MLFLLAINKAAYATSWNFAVFGDTRSNSTTDSGVNAAAITAIATDISTNRNASFVLIVGDLIYGNGSSTSVADQFTNFKNAAANGGLQVVGESGSKVSYYPVRGNHDHNVIDTSGTAWKTAFSTLPQNGPTTDSGGNGNSEVGMTYSFTSGNSLFLGLDEYINNATYPYQVNQAWVTSQLNNSTATHVFAFGHQPAYRANHADCLAYNATARTARDAFLTSLYSKNGQMYFAGHDHLSAVARANIGGDASKLFYPLIFGAGGAPFSSFNGTYSDSNVTGFYYNSSSSATQYYAYILITVDGDLVWLRLYGTTSVSSPSWSNLYSLVVSGTLTADTNTLTSDVANDSTINFNQTSDGTYANVISGTGSLTKSGSGTLTLSGDNTYSGATTVNAGTLNVTGSSSSTPVTVNSGATLEGVGTIKSLTNYGTVKPGNSVGILNLNGGAFTQGASGRLEIEVESISIYDEIIGASTASLDGTLKTTTSGSYTIGNTLSGIIRTAGGITGTFSFLDTQITPTIVWKPQVNANNLDLDLVATRDYNNDALNVTLTADEKNVAAMMQAELPSATADLATVKTAIDSMDTNAKVADAYSQISPEKFEGIPSVAFSNAAMQFNHLQEHMYALRSGEIKGFTFNRHTGAFCGDLFNGLLLAYNGNDLGGLISRDNVQAQNENGLEFFVNGEGNFGDQDFTDSQPGFHYSAGGITAGLDYRFAENLVAGFNLGYTRTASHLGGSGGKVDVDSVSYGIYGTYFRNNFYTNVASGFSSNFYDMERDIEFGGLDRKAKADTFGKQLNLSIGTGYDFQIKQLTTGPTATVKYSRLWIDSFSESGADSLNLHIADQRAESFQLGLGWRAEHELRVGKKTVVPQVRVSYQHEFSNDSRTIEARLEGGSNTFQVTTDKPTRDFALVGCGIRVKLRESVSFNAGYDAQVGQRNYVAQSIYGSVSFSF